MHKEKKLTTRIPGPFLGLAIGVVALTLGSTLVQGKEHQVPSKGDQVAVAAQRERGQAVNAHRPASTNPNEAVAAGSAYKIAPGDVLVVDVWKEPEITQTETVRPDGKISLPLVGDFTASGLTPEQLGAELTQKLGKFVDAPHVTIILKETKSRRVNVLGMVAKPGSYPLTNRMTVLDAIAAAGGLKEFAKAKKIYVLRTGPNGVSTRLHFNYKKVIKGKGPGQDINLESADTVVVP